MHVRFGDCGAVSQVRADGLNEEGGGALTAEVMTQKDAQPKLVILDINSCAGLPGL